ncbi:MAG: restriction endonuclease subunit S [Parasphingorhabdus sp.]
MIEWQAVRIEEISQRIAMGPFGSNIKTDNFVSSGVPVIRGGNLNDIRLDLNNVVFLTQQKADELKNSNAFPGDLVFTHRGTLGQVGLIPNEPYPRYVVSQSQMLLSCDRSKAIPEFIYYFFKSPIGQQRLLANRSQTGVPAIARPTASLKSIKISLPSIKEQQAIADALVCHDDKIELNRQMNATLEAMTQAIFRDWFVDFGPVHRKAAGEIDPTAILGSLVLDPEKAGSIASLFPDSFGDNGLPAGWDLAPLEKTLVLQRGFDLPKKTRTDGKFPVIAASGPSGTHREFKVSGPGVCTGRSGILGNVYFVEEDFWPLNTSLWIKAYPNSTPLYAYHVLGEIDLESFNAGSAVPSLNRNHIHGLPTTRPPMPIVLAFDEIGMVLYRKRQANKTENKSLAETRDYILPRLMSGKVRAEWCKETKLDG